MAYIGKTPVVGNFQVCDAISVVNGQAAYTLQVGGANVIPESANHMLVSLNGILQKPGSSFTISGSTMTFASNLATGDVIDFVQILGNVLDIGQPSDDTVKTASIQANAVTGAKLNTDVISAQTALTSSPADTDELLISDAGVLKRIDVSLVGGANTPAFFAYLNTKQTVSDNAITKIQIEVEDFDTDSAYDNSTNYRFTPQTAGKYYVNVSVLTDTDEAGATSIDGLDVYIYKNGSAYANSRNDMQSNEFRMTYATVEAIIDFNGSSDYVEPYARLNVNTGTPIFEPSTAWKRATRFSAYKIIE
jgi:hypothetical protein